MADQNQSKNQTEEEKIKQEEFQKRVKGKLIQELTNFAFTYESCKDLDTTPLQGNNGAVSYIEAYMGDGNKKFDEEFIVKIMNGRTADLSEDQLLNTFRLLHNFKEHLNNRIGEMQGYDSLSQEENSILESLNGMNGFVNRGLGKMIESEGFFTAAKNNPELKNEMDKRVLSEVDPESAYGNPDGIKEQLKNIKSLVKKSGRWNVLESHFPINEMLCEAVSFDCNDGQNTSYSFDIKRQKINNLIRINPIQAMLELNVAENHFSDIVEKKRSVYEKEINAGSSKKDINDLYLEIKAFDKVLNRIEKLKDRSEKELEKQIKGSPEIEMQVGKKLLSEHGEEYFKTLSEKNKENYGGYSSAKKNDVFINGFKDYLLEKHPEKFNEVKSEDVPNFIDEVLKRVEQEEKKIAEYKEKAVKKDSEGNTFLSTNDPYYSAFKREALGKNGEMKKIGTIHDYRVNSFFGIPTSNSYLDENENETLKESIFGISLNKNVNDEKRVESMEAATMMLLNKSRSDKVNVTFAKYEKPELRSQIAYGCAKACAEYYLQKNGCDTVQDATPELLKESMRFVNENFTVQGFNKEQIKELADKMHKDFLAQKEELEGDTMIQSASLNQTEVDSFMVGINNNDPAKIMKYLTYNHEEDCMDKSLEDGDLTKEDVLKKIKDIEDHLNAQMEAEEDPEKIEEIKKSLDSVKEFRLTFMDTFKEMKEKLNNEMQHDGVISKRISEPKINKDSLSDLMGGVIRKRQKLDEEKRKEKQAKEERKKMSERNKANRSPSSPQPKTK